MNEKIFIELMKKMAKESGRIAMDLIQDSSPSLKPDGSILTAADTNISKFIREQLQGYLEEGTHILIDEEAGDYHARYLHQELLDATPYIWAVDPIDGTRCFSNHMHHFGISIGLIKNLRPWMGIVYFPFLQELFFCDGAQSYFVQNAFCEEEISSMIMSIDHEITEQSIFLINDLFFQEFNWDYSLCRVMMPSCAIADLCWPAVGRGCGSILKAHIWDFAGSWPIFQSAGMKLRNYLTGESLSGIRSALFIDQGPSIWKLRDYYILSSERNFLAIKNNISMNRNI